MDFTYRAYGEMLDLLKKNEYSFASYHDYGKRCVILRHDVDFCLEDAVKIAELEANAGVFSTFFVLLRTSFYNVASTKGNAAIKRILALGHKIGLHFDEAAYEALDAKGIADKIKEEAHILSLLCGVDINVVSMHRPSKHILEENITIDGMINSYGTAFFSGFKYVSDSRRRWREPVLDIINSQSYDRLHILTHPIWYHSENLDIRMTVGDFLSRAERERFESLKENITDLNSIVAGE